MKRSLCILLIAILLLQSGVLVLYFQCHQLIVKIEMKERMNLDETKFETMLLSVADYHRSIVNSHEITIGGEMYDVKTVKYVQGKVELKLIHDKHEGNIIKKIKYALESRSDDSSTLPLKCIKLISLQYLLPSENVKLNLIPITVRSIQNDVYSLTAIPIEVISPPPQSFV